MVKARKIRNKIMYIKLKLKTMAEERNKGTQLRTLQE